MKKGGAMWYQVVLDVDDDNTFFVTAPRFPEVTTFGANLEEALLHGRAAIEETIAARIARGEDIPIPLPQTTGKGEFVQIPALTYLKCGLYMNCKTQGITRAELQRRLGWHREQVDRLFRIDHKSRLDQIEDALRAVGIESIFSLPTAKAA